MRNQKSNTDNHKQILMIINLSVVLVEIVDRITNIWIQEEDLEFNELVCRAIEIIDKQLENVSVK